MAYPKRSPNHKTENDAVKAFHYALDNNLFISQREDRSDFGTDIQIEACNDNEMPNVRIHVQLKGTETEPNIDNSISVSVDSSNLNYLYTQPNSIYVCYHLPSKRLLVRFVSDVIREYEGEHRNWHDQKTVTIKFLEAFDNFFQKRLHSLAIISHEELKQRRNLWDVTPTNEITSLLNQVIPFIEIPNSPERAKEILEELYKLKSDLIISHYFNQFDAVLGHIPGSMDLAYMSEVNLGIDGYPIKKDRVERSINIFKKAIEQKTHSLGSLLYCIGNAWLALEDYKQAKEFYCSALPVLDQEGLVNLSAMCHKNLGSTFTNLGCAEFARINYERALELDPNLNEAYFALGVLSYKHENNSTLSLEYFDQVDFHKESSSRQISLYGWRLAALFEIGDIGGAFRELNNLINHAEKFDWIFPWCAKHVNRFGRSSVQAAKKAIRFWQKYLEEYPNHNLARREYLVCMFYLRNHGENITLCFKDIKKELVSVVDNGIPDAAFLWDKLGHWAQDEGNWEEAEEAFRHAYEADPTGHYAYCLGTALNFLGRFKESLPILKTYVEFYPLDDMGWLQLGAAYGDLKNHEGAINAYLEAIKLNAEYDLAWFNLGGAYWNANNIGQAIEIWHEAIKKFPNHEMVKLLQEKIPLFSK